jgi:hypothetical protein
MKHIHQLTNLFLLVSLELTHKHQIQKAVPESCQCADIRVLLLHSFAKKFSLDLLVIICNEITHMLLLY